MKISTVFLGVEKVTYAFSKGEILDALVRQHNIKLTSDYEFDLFEGFEDDPPRAELIVRYTKETENK